MWSRSVEPAGATVGLKEPGHAGRRLQTRHWAFVGHFVISGFRQPFRFRFASLVVTGDKGDNTGF